MADIAEFMRKFGHMLHRPSTVAFVADAQRRLNRVLNQSSTVAIVADAQRRLNQVLNQQWDEFHETQIVYRCATCGERVGRRRGRFQMPNGLTCGTHGELAGPTIGELRDEWTRRGKPDQLNLRLPPV